MSDAALSPVQRRTLDRLKRGDEPVVFDRAFVADIRDEMRAAVDHFSGRLDDRQELWISKHKIAAVLECETYSLEPDEFEWTTANAKGTIAHRAIELLVSWRGDPTPIDLVDEALSRLADENSGIGLWVAALTAGDEADVRGQSVERVTSFVENFPPLSKRWRPVMEASVRWPSGGPITLAGKVDLLFGKPDGLESRKVIVDLKTGRPHVRHRQDLAFYALLETLVREIPPRKVATFYLDAAEAHADEVTEALLETAMRRTLDAINAIVELSAERRPPRRQAGSSCRWCSLRTTCDVGMAYLAPTED